MSTIQLTAVEARVLAALVEKSIATPQYYPMSANAIMLACNQKTSRSPVMSLSEGEVGATLNALEPRKLVRRDDRISRVVKWYHQFNHQLLVDAPAQALLATLMLRGPQTAAELRTNASGIGGPAEGAAFTGVLDMLCERGLALQLPRAPGQSQARYAHHLTPHRDVQVPRAQDAQERPPHRDVQVPRAQDAQERPPGPAVEASPAPAADPEPPVPTPQLMGRIDELERRVAELERRLHGDQPSLPLELPDPVPGAESEPQ